MWVHSPKTYSNKEQTHEHRFTTVEYLVLEQQPYIMLEQPPYIVLQHRNRFTTAIHSAPIELEHTDPPTIGSF